MTRTLVVSSNLHSVGYDFSKATLEIEFNDMSVYQYHFVPEIIYRSLLHAGSKGKYFDQNIKKLFDHTKVR